MVVSETESTSCRRQGAAVLLADPLPQVRAAIAKDAVAGEFGLGGRRQHVAVGDIVHVVDGIAPALQEEGHDEDAIETAAQPRGQGVHLAGVVAAQGGVAPADHDKAAAGSARRRGQVGGDLAVQAARGFQRQGARVGEDVKDRGLAPQLSGQRGNGPLGEDGHAGDGLGAGGVVVQHDDLPATLPDQAANLRQEIAGRFRRKAGEEVGEGGRRGRVCHGPTPLDETDDFWYITPAHGHVV